MRMEARWPPASRCSAVGTSLLRPLVGVATWGREVRPRRVRLTAAGLWVGAGWLHCLRPRRSPGRAGHLRPHRRSQGGRRERPLEWDARGTGCLAARSGGTASCSPSGFSPRTLPALPTQPALPWAPPAPLRGSLVKAPRTFGPWAVSDAAERPTGREGRVGHRPFSPVPSTGAGFLASKWAFGGLSTLIRMAGDGPAEGRAAAHLRAEPAGSTQPPGAQADAGLVVSGFSRPVVCSRLSR